MKGFLRGRLLRVLGVGLVAAALVVAARHVDFAQVLAALARADPLLLCSAVPALLALNLLLRSARFHVLVQALPAPPSGRFRFADSSRSFLASLAANNLMPLRLGELVRTRDLVSRGYSLGAVALAQVTEKGVEAVTMMACAAPLVPLGLVRMPPLATALAAAGLAAAALVGFVLWRRRARRGILNPRAIASSLGWSLGADVAELALIAACLAALGIPPGWRAAIAVFVGINLAIAIPSTPAQLGAFEAGGAIALTLTGVAPDLAVAFALLYRVVHWVPTTLLGAVLGLMGRTAPPAARAGQGPDDLASARR